MIINMTGGLGGTGFPEFTYTGDYQLLDDGDKNWRLFLLTSGSLKFNKQRGIANGIDIFCVGGGAGGAAGVEYTESGQKLGGYGGSGAHSTTASKIVASVGEEYEIIIGAGGAGQPFSGSSSTSSNNPGGTSSAFSIVAEGGSGLSTDRTTYEFNGTEGNVYGAAGANRSPVDAAANTGNGGGGGKTIGGGNSGADGGSGVVVIRNARG